MHQPKIIVMSASIRFDAYALDIRQAMLEAGIAADIDISGHQLA